MLHAIYMYMYVYLELHVQKSGISQIEQSGNMLLCACVYENSESMYCENSTLRRLWGSPIPELKTQVQQVIHNARNKHYTYMYIYITEEHMHVMFVHCAYVYMYTYTYMYMCTSVHNPME